MLYNVVLKSNTSFLDRVFTYKYDEELEIGTRVIVPFGKANSKNIGLIVSKSDEVVDFEVKNIVDVLDSRPIVNKELIDIAFYMIKNNISDYASAINSILPPGSIDKVTEYYKAKESLEDIDKELYLFLDDYKNFEQINQKFNEKYKKSEISNLLRIGHIESYLAFDKKASTKYLELVSLIDKNWEDKIKKNASSQIKLLDYLSKNGKIEKSELLSQTSTSTSSLKSLIEKKIIKVEKLKVYREVLNEVDSYKKHSLTSKQEEVLNSIISSSDTNFLIHGITGSGKTEIYLQLVEYYLKLDKEAIILVPEISLTPQTIARFQGRFGNNIAVLHSKLSISERADQWRMIKNKDVKIVVGARSAIFAPFDNLGVIIIDEEHESSYKSEKNPKYSAIDIAKFRAKYNNAKLVLGSATPSIKTIDDANKGEFSILQLNERANKSSLPTIDIVDMREELKVNNFSMFSNKLREAVENAINKKEQVILFLNKRGHSSFVFCRHCGYVHKCEACDVSMTYHKTIDRLICHYCGRTSNKDKKCINCGSSWIKEYGAGTEMLEEETQKLFPKAKIYRMDADTVNKKQDYENVYRMMKDQEIDILIGTQMLAKGLDFPNVSVVGIVSADVSLNVPDFRAGERTYNLITQVAGRAGRGKVEGNVIVQTYNPDHYAIKFAAKNDYYKFFESELKGRITFRYPPYINILNINLSSKDRSYAYKYGQKLTRVITSFLRQNEKIELIDSSGPVASRIEKINNRYRFDIILKSHNKDDLVRISEELRKYNDSRVYVNYRLEED